MAGMTRAQLLRAHIDAVEGKPVVWGEDDCTSWAASWIKRATGKEVPFLGTYGDLETAHRLIDEAGGLDVLWTQALAQVGIYSTTYDPALGDVGVVDTSSFGPVGVIFAQDGVALWRSDHGTALLRPRRRTIIKTWALPVSD